MSERRERRWKPRTAAALAIATALLVAAEVPAQVSDAERALLEDADVSASAPEAFRARMRVTRGASDEATELEVWKDAAGRALVRLLDARERGKYVLETPEGMWLISPGTRRPVPLAKSLRMFAGASLQELLGYAYSRDYRIEGVTYRGEPPSRLAELELVAEAEGLPYPRVTYVVRESTRRPVRIEHYLPSGKLARMVELAEWAEGDELQPAELVIKDILRGSAPTRVEIIELEPATPDPGLFSLEDDAARSALEAGETPTPPGDGAPPPEGGGAPPDDPSLP